MTGCPIRTPADQFLFADPRRFSQLTASFIADGSPGIRRVLLSNFSLKCLSFRETAVPYTLTTLQKNLANHI